MKRSVAEPQIVEELKSTILSLRPSARKKLWDELIKTNAFSEDEEDILILQTRKNEEGGRPYKEIRKELIKRGKL